MYQEEVKDLMYKVMLVDDDYPVLEFLSETIEWNRLGFELIGVHENGESALQHALQQMPNLLITDIGMPKLNGIELTRRLREQDDSLQVCVLTCHNEFEFAQQALKLNVQDYLLKDTLNPEDLTAVLKRIKAKLDAEQQKKEKELHLQQIVERNKESMKRDFLRKTIYQSIYHAKEWYEEASSFGLHLHKQSYIPVLCFIQDYRLAKETYQSADVLSFSLQNVILEILEREQMNPVYFSFEAKESFIFFPFKPTLKSDCFGNAAECLRKVQRAVAHHLHVSLSMMIGDVFHNEQSLKHELGTLLMNTNQRFYMEKDAIEKKRTGTYFTDKIFSWYEEASTEVRQLILERNEERVAPTVKGWIQHFKDQQISSDAVKDWVLKLVLDLKVKLKALQFFETTYTMEVLHEEILNIDSLYELSDWLNSYFQTVMHSVAKITAGSRRREVMEACKYVSMHLERKISLDEVASYLYLNPSYFSRLFKKEVGETFVEYVTKLKINRAKELLEHTIEPVGKICERLGYDNQSYFIKVFKNNVGVTPMEFRGQIS